MPNRTVPKASVRSSSAKEVSVLAWIQDAYGQILLVQQTAGKQLWSLPGGKVHSGESLRKGLARELKEEIGVAFLSAREIDLFDRPGKSALAVLFQVTLRKGSFKLKKDEITAVAFHAQLPAESTPSLRHFWRHQTPRLFTKLD